MRRLVRSGVYARAKVFSGGLFVLFGALIVVRTVVVVGARFETIPGIVLGCAMIGLGALRLRDARAAVRR